MAKICKEIKIENELGLHARPAAQFVQIAIKFDSDIAIIKGDERVDGKSIMGILTLEAHFGTVIQLEVEGEDAQEAMDALENILKGNQ